MARITVDIDSSVLAEAKALARKRRRTLGETLSLLIARALAESDAAAAHKPAFRWTSQRMEPLIDLEDKEALWRILDADQFPDLPVAETRVDSDDEGSGASFEWVTKPMGIKMDLEDKDAVEAALAHEE